MKLIIFEIIFLFHFISSGSCIFTYVNQMANELAIINIIFNQNNTGLFSIILKGTNGCEISMKLNFSDFIINQPFYGNNKCASLQLSNWSSSNGEHINDYNIPPEHKMINGSFKLIFNELKFPPEQYYEITFYDYENVLFYNSSFKTPSSRPSEVRNVECYYNEEDLILSWDRPSRVGGGILEYRVGYPYYGNKYLYFSLKCSKNCANYTKIGNKGFYLIYYKFNEFTQEFDGNQKSFQFTINKSFLSSTDYINIEAVNEWGVGYSVAKFPPLCLKIESLNIQMKYSPITNAPDQVNVTLDLVVQEPQGVNPTLDELIFNNNTLEEQKKKLTRPQQYLVMLSDKRDSTGQCILWTIICGCQTQSSMTGANSDASTRHGSSTKRMRGGCNQSKILLFQSSSTQYNYCHTLPQLSTTVILNSKASEPVSMEIRSQTYNGFIYSKETTQIFNISSIH